jgi:hypothetical protein
MESLTFEQPTATTTPTPLSENTPLTSTPRDSAALRRLMDEVRNEDASGSPVTATYDRAHNRHNR